MPATSEQINRLYRLINEYKDDSRNLEIMSGWLDGLDAETQEDLVNQVHEDADTSLLSFACKRKYEGIIRCLLKNNASVDLFDRNKEYPMHFAVKSQNEAIIRMIGEVVSQLPVESRTQLSECGRKPLTEALEIENPKFQHTIVKYLLEVGVNPNRGSESNNPLISAIINHTKTNVDNGVIDALLGGGASVGLGDKPLSNAFLLAASHGNRGAAQIILDHKIPAPWTVSKMKEIALEMGCQDFVDWLAIGESSLSESAKRMSASESSIAGSPAKRCKVESFIEEAQGPYTSNAVELGGGSGQESDSES